MQETSTVMTVAMAFIFAALAFYTVGVWAERIGGRLKPWHAIVFWIGVACDTTGTTAMAISVGGMFQSTIHGVTGLLAIILMLVHATWASVVLVRKNERMILSFHKFSVFVWVFWLVPMVGGAVFGSTV